MERPTGCADTSQWQDYADHLEQQIKELEEENQSLDIENDQLLLDNMMDTMKYELTPEGSE